MSEIFGADTFPRITGFDITSDGLRYIYANSSDDVVRSGKLATAWDFSTATRVSGTGATNVTGVQWCGDDGVKHAFYLGATDLLSVRTQNTPYLVSNGDRASEITAADSEFGVTTSNEPAFQFNADGSAIYVTPDVATVQHIRRYELGSAYNIDSIGSFTTLNVDATFTNLVALSSSMIVSCDEKYMLLTENNKTYLCTMSTPGDVSTMTIDTVNTLTHTAIECFQFVNPQFTKYYVCDTITSAPKIAEYDIPSA
jgi:hypothetical protein